MTFSDPCCGGISNGNGYKSLVIFILITSTIGVIATSVQVSFCYSICREDSYDYGSPVNYTCFDPCYAYAWCWFLLSAMAMSVAIGMFVGIRRQIIIQTRARDPNQHPGAHRVVQPPPYVVYSNGPAPAVILTNSVQGGPQGMVMPGPSQMYHQQPMMTPGMTQAYPAPPPYSPSAPNTANFEQRGVDNPGMAKTMP